MKRLSVDLVIVNEHASSYLQDLQAAIDTAVRTSQSRPRFGEELAQGSIYALRADLMSVDALALLQSAARVVLVARRGSIADQIDRLSQTPIRPAPLHRQKMALSVIRPSQARAPVGLEFFNGLGGFAKDGREYVIFLDGGRMTPAVDQCDRQSLFRLPGVSGRKRLHLGGKQPREPDHTVVQRSGRGPDRGSNLRPRRNNRRTLEYNGATDPG